MTITDTKIEKVRWGILGAANIAVKKVIPAMQAGRYGVIEGIASRNLGTAEQIAAKFDIPKFYGSYAEILADRDIDAVYIPLPNHLHVDWSIRAAEAGKHVLVEKPVGMNAGEVRKLIEFRDRTGVKIQEAFMTRTHPQWTGVYDLVRSGRIGELTAITGNFSYTNVDPQNIRNQADIGGGGLMDIGCYCVNMSRWLFGCEPDRVTGLIKRDVGSGIDSLTSSMLEFPTGHASFTCSTQMVPFQRMQILGTKGRIEVQIPFNIPPTTPTRILVDDGSDLYEKGAEIVEFAAADQYTIQSDLFSLAIRSNSEQAISLEDSFGNMAVIDAIFRSAETGRVEVPEKL